MSSKLLFFQSGDDMRLAVLQDLKVSCKTSTDNCMALL